MLFQPWNLYCKNYSIVQSQTRNIKQLHQNVRFLFFMILGLFRQCVIILFFIILKLLYILFSYSKRDDFTFSIVNLPFISSNIPAHYSCFLDRAPLLTQELLKQGHVAPRLKSSPQKFYGRHHNLVDRYEISIYLK